MKNKYSNGGNMILATALAYLAITHFRHLNAFMFKLGMSHLFTPTIVGILAYALPLLNVLSLILVVMIGNRMTYLLAALIFLLYTTYNIYLLISTGSECGCANVLFNIDLRIQAVTFLVLSAISAFMGLTYAKNRKTVSQHI
ncbi:hypothetical protein HGH93_09655 [Chitinophaga polysaccharea]|uniref:MauE/DoxX family redox-associated membrane protein n=1 Tax=Chitinophaga TaxID=79328 RepID=UPI0014553D34|nr:MULTISPECIES: MauE/DoxX family redox-associated membrane protein [Chitinophaga]NLR58363.1 hypothetical protein [Chitinophaga polysaccharea]NLU90890.1 hypothetical protein [Chitinophaga sp. Ak27]